MPANLSECRARCEWARGHIRSLNAIIQPFRTAAPYQSSETFNDQTGKWEVRIKSDPVPAEIPLMVGDVLHNLRSTLDHLVWQLTLGNGHEAPRFPLDEASKHWRRIQFPICDDEGCYKGAVGRELWGVSSRNHAYIRSFQPFEEIKEPGDSSTLAMLRDLSNIDKHRIPNVAASWLHRYQIEGTLTRNVDPGQWPGEFSSGTVICTYERIEHPMRDLDFRIAADIDLMFREESGIGRGMPILDTLSAMEGLVFAIVHGAGP